MMAASSAHGWNGPHGCVDTKPDGFTTAAGSPGNMFGNVPWLGANSGRRAHDATHAAVRARRHYSCQQRRASAPQQDLRAVLGGADRDAGESGLAGLEPVRAASP